MKIDLSIQDPAQVRALAADPRLTSLELFPGQPTGHLFAPGEKALLAGLTDFAEFNGQEVEITAIREDGAWGRTYYFKGAANAMLNWVYENRLQKIEAPAADYQI